MTGSWPEPSKGYGVTGSWPEPSKGYGVTGSWEAPQSHGASGGWKYPPAPAPAPSAATRGSGAAPTPAPTPTPTESLYRTLGLARRPTPDGEFPPIPRTDETLPLWKQVYDELRAESERAMPAGFAKNDFPDAIRERALVARVDREVKRRYWSVR